MLYESTARGRRFCHGPCLYKTLGVAGLFQHTELLADLDEGVDATVELLAGVGGTELNADAGLTLRHYGIVEAGDVDALVEQAVGVLLRQRSVVEHHGTDGTLRGLDVEAGSHHLVAEVVDVLHEFVVQ